MQKCPQCGYKQGPNWPLVLFVISFNVLYVVWMLGNYQPKEFKLIGLVAYLSCWVAIAGMLIRNKPTVPHKRDDEEMRSNG